MSAEDGVETSLKGSRFDSLSSSVISGSREGPYEDTASISLRPCRFMEAGHRGWQTVVRAPAADARASEGVRQARSAPPPAFAISPGATSRRTSRYGWADAPPYGS